MARLVLLNIVMFLAPFVIYGIYVYVTRKPQDTNSYWHQAPLGWLVAAGFVMVFIGITVVISFSGGPPGGRYTPPSIEDGQIRPGHIE